MLLLGAALSLVACAAPSAPPAAARGDGMDRAHDFGIAAVQASVFFGPPSQPELRLEDLLVSFDPSEEGYVSLRAVELRGGSTDSPSGPTNDGAGALLYEATFPAEPGQNRHYEPRIARDVEGGRLRYDPRDRRYFLLISVTYRYTDEAHGIDELRVDRGRLDCFDGDPALHAAFGGIYAPVVPPGQ